MDNKLVNNADPGFTIKMARSIVQTFQLCTFARQWTQGGTASEQRMPYSINCCQENTKRLIIVS